MTGKHPARLHITDYMPGSPFPYAKLITPQQAPCLPVEEITIAEALLGGANPVNLYNLREDIGERNDLAHDMPEKVAELREKLRKWRTRVGAQEMKINPNYNPGKADSGFL